MAETLILTRPADQSRDFAAALEAAAPGRFTVLAAPLIEIVPVAAVLDLEGMTALAFTSANGVRQFAERCAERALPAYCVGDLTAAAARAAGLTAVSADGDVEALAALIADRVPGGAVLHVRGRHATGDLAARLSGHGIAVRAAALYDQLERRLAAEAVAALTQGATVAFFSPRTARVFAAQARAHRWDLGRAASVSLSAAADAGLEGLGFQRRQVATAPTRAEMLRALCTD